MEERLYDTDDARSWRFDVYPACVLWFSITAFNNSVEAVYKVETYCEDAVSEYVVWSVLNNSIFADNVLINELQLVENNPPNVLIDDCVCVDACNTFSK